MDSDNLDKKRSFWITFNRVDECQEIKAYNLKEATDIGKKMAKEMKTNFTGASETKPDFYW